MQIQDYIVSLATNMKQLDFDLELNTKVLKKTMDLTNTIAEGVVDMINSVPPPFGAIGGSMDVYA